MFFKPITLVTFSLALMFSSVSAKSAHATDSLFADGKPWVMSGSDGHSGQVIFNASGTGKIKSGIFAMNLTWLNRASATCFKMGVMAEQCFILSGVPKGFDGVERGGKRKMTLRRN
jgi:hypothetical protein